MGELPRRLELIVRRALGAFRAVVVTGPRQSGKTTLVRRVLGTGGTFARLDRQATLQAALEDPAGFAAFGETPRAFDEVQRAGEPLVRAIKDIVDHDPGRGQFLLNGSADFLTVPTISESLAGRAAFLELWPFSQGELHDAPDEFLQAVFADPELMLDGRRSSLAPEDYLERICAGGFPEATRMSPRERGMWFRNYIHTVVQRDIKDLTGARRVRELPTLLSLLAARTAGELIVEHVHDAVGLGSRATTESYLGYLEMTHLTVRIPAWSRNLSSKVARRPKIHIVDSGLGSHLLGKNPLSLARPTDPARGQLLESFVVNELYRQATWLDFDVRLHHFRDRNGIEVDVIAEAADGRFAAIEVKSAPSANQRDARHLAWLRERAPDEFWCGIVLHTGERAYRLHDRIFAVPVSHLWTTRCS